jgi:hypothetical protein
MDSRPTNGESAAFRWRRRPTRHAIWWATALAVSLSGMLAGGGLLLLGDLYLGSGSHRSMSLGVTLFAFGFAASVLCFVLWMVSGKNDRAEDGQ